ncbi:hypothetical protein ABIC71_003909 [Herbaspirillum seropedicae]|uniref:hypothetical protein n=1 Tax=Herbaspirillum seropedicae TaxID=964 RepID=UPI00339628AD
MTGWQRTRKVAAVITIATAVATGCYPATAAGADNDSEALSLADSATTTATTRRDWHATFEVGLGSYSAASQATNADMADTLRLSSSISYDKALTSDWRVFFSNRLDAGWRDGTGQYNAINTLKQAYLSWQPSETTVFDVGRINLREGVASGFNPTDFFKANAIRSIVSIDPASLRENRLGSVMLRNQVLWPNGAFSWLVSPKLASQPSEATFNPDFGATNSQTRYMLTLTQRLFGTVAPQWLLYGGDGIAPQLGMNVAMLLNSGTTGFFEYAGGRGMAFSTSSNGSQSFHSRLATGLTHTFANNLSLTIEYDYDGASADHATWSGLATDPVRYWQYRSKINAAQDLTTRQALFSYVTWQDAFVRRLNMTAMMHYDLTDHSSSTWLEARYQWTRADVALQWKTNRGASYSSYGADLQKQVWQAVLTFFF